MFRVCCACCLLLCVIKKGEHETTYKDVKTNVGVEA